MPTKKIFYLFYPSDGACNYHRVLQPARFCHERYEKEWDFLVGPGPAHGHEVYYFSGLPNVKDAPNTLLEIQYLKRKGAKFIWSVDDDWLSIPDWNPAKPDIQGLCGYDIMKQLADYIIVSTKYLAKTFDDVKEKVFICPNLLDLDMFPKVLTEEFTDNNGERGRRYHINVQNPVRVVFTGSETHSGDVSEIEEVLDEFLGKYCGIGNNNKAVVLFSGILPPGNITKKYLHKGLLHQSMVPFPSYHTIASSLQPHVYLAPLAKIPFNEGKSNLRIIEGWALCAPSVATSWGEYSNTIVHGKDGLVSSTKQQFYNDLVEIVTNHEYRLYLASHGRMRVEMQYNWQKEQCRELWYKAFDKILDFKP